MMSKAQTSDTLREWEESAKHWETHAHTIRTMFAPVTHALIQDAGIREGYKVLDVAAGPGEPSLSIAGIVGPSGSVMCTDAVAAMVKAAEREARRRAVTNTRFRQCSVDALPFDDNVFDAVVSRLGVMFFPNPLVGLSEMLRVTKPNGAISLAVWAKSDLNPFSYVVTNVVSLYTETPPADPSAPSAFRFAEPGTLAQILKEAGASDVNERELRFYIEAPITPEEFWEMRSNASGTLRDKLASVSRREAAKIGREVQEAVWEFFPNNQMRFPARMLIVSGTKP